MAAQPPPPIDLATLSRLAAEFDAISRGRHWPAYDFVEFLRSELLTADEQRAELRRERQREKMRRWRAVRAGRD